MRTLPADKPVDSHVHRLDTDQALTNLRPAVRLHRGGVKLPRLLAVDGPGDTTVRARVVLVACLTACRQESDARTVSETTHRKSSTHGPRKRWRR